MKLARFFLTGIFFGIVLTKAEAVSWYRIYEMFQFQSFHMYGIIGTALVTGIVGLQIIKKKKLKDYNGFRIFDLYNKVHSSNPVIQFLNQPFH